MVVCNYIYITSCTFSSIYFPIKNYPPVLFSIISFIIYIIFYFFRFIHVLSLDEIIIEWIWTQLVLLGTSQFTYVIGMMAYEYSNNEFVEKIFDKSSHKNLKVTISVILIFTAFVGHAIIQSVFVAPFTAIAVIVSIGLIKLPKTLENILMFLGKHSTNIWLVHMFVIGNIFGRFVFIAKYPILIVLLVFAICILFSYAISWIYNKVLKKVKLK